MHFNVLILHLCLLSASDLIIAHPTSGMIAHRGVATVDSVVQPRLHRRGGAAAQLQQISCTTPPAAGGEQQAGAGEEAAAESKVYYCNTIKG
jgi:hypothetical protein